MTDEPSITKYASPLVKLGVGIIVGVAAAEVLKNSHNPSEHTINIQSSTPGMYMQRTTPQGITTNAANVAYTAVSPVALPVR